MTAVPDFYLVTGLEYTLCTRHTSRRAPFSSPKGRTMKALFIYPSIPDTFWSFKHIMKFIRKKAAHVPLGLLTVACHVSQGLGH